MRHDHYHIFRNGPYLAGQYEVIEGADVLVDLRSGDEVAWEHATEGGHF